MTTSGLGILLVEVDQPQYGRGDPSLGCGATILKTSDILLFLAQPFVWYGQYTISSAALLHNVASQWPVHAPLDIMQYCRCKWHPEGIVPEILR